MPSIPVNNEMIKFYKGSLNNLPTYGASGAIYITTDEGGIYLGTGDGMKRLGDFIQVDAVANLPTGGANTTALYYCVAENVLAKWNGSSWTQVNKQPTAAEMKTLLGLGSMAYLSEVAEDNLSADLKAKVNASAEANHGHENKGVIDGITAEKVAAWDAAENNAKGYADGLNTAMDERVDALEAAIGENGSVATQIKTAIEALDYTDTAVDGEYVSAVNEVDGKISVTRKALPDYSNTYDAKGAADTAFENAKAYADGLAANYDEKGAAAGVKTELEAEIAKKVDKVDGKSLVDNAEITKLAGVSAGANKVEASTNGSIKIDGVDTVVYTHPDKHAIADVDGLQAALDGKQAAGDYSLEGHKHVAADITDLDATIKGYNYATKGELEGVDAKFADYVKSSDYATDKTATENALADRYTKSEADGKFAVKGEDAYDDTALAGRVTALEGASATHALKTDVEALAGKVGTVPEGQTVMGIITNIQENAYDDTELRGEISDLEAYVGTFTASEGVDTVVKYIDAADAKALEDAKAYTDEEITGLEIAIEKKENVDFIVIKNKAGSEVASVDATAFVKDGMLTDAEYNTETNKLTLTWNTDAGITATDIDLNDLVDTYTGGNGINVATDGEISIDTNVVATLTAVEEALDEAKGYTDDAKAAVIGTADDTYSADTIKGAKKYAEYVADSVQSEVAGLNNNLSPRIEAAQATADEAKAAAEANAEAIEAAKIEAANQDAVVLAEAQAYADQAEADAIAAAEGKVNALAGNVYTKEDVYTKADIETFMSWGEF